jgi:hypothetical protein
MPDSVQLGSLLQGVNGLSGETLLSPAGPDHVTADVVDEHAVKYPYRTSSTLCGNRFPIHYLVLASTTSSRRCIAHSDPFPPARIFVRCSLHARLNRETVLKFDM